MTNTVKNLETARDALVTRVKELPDRVVSRVKAIDLNIELPSAASSNLKAFAPIDLTALQARLVEIPAFVQGLVTDLPEAATKLVADAKTKTVALLEQLTGRTPAPRKASKPAARKTTAKKAGPKTTTAKSSTTKKTTAKTSTVSKAPAKKTPDVPPVTFEASAPARVTNGNGMTSGTLHA